MKENSEKVAYTKKPLSIRNQIVKLKSRGLIVDDEKLAANYLGNISYYRLRAYTYPFQNNTDEDSDHAFIRNDIHFKDIIDLYCFDRRLRSLVFNAIEKIEVSVRTKMVQIYGDSTGDSHWYQDDSLFKDDSYFIENENGEREEVFKYDDLIFDIENEVDRSNEDFIKHYKSKYNNPELPPAWMTLEVVSMGTLSRIYELLKKSIEVDEDKKSKTKEDSDKFKIAKSYGLNSIDVFENWLHGISNLRNCCAHHSRIWNRRFIVSLKIPTNTDSFFLDRETAGKIHKNKLFAYLCAIKYILDIISPGNDFKTNLFTLISNGGKLLSLKDMGFPENWKYLGVWRS